ncbi:MAG: hypothetical protein OXU88_08395 [Gammaproteobacteria bacterium]|nr:hypothetical protein [Gammaproteobacteria bacterium]
MKSPKLPKPFQIIQLSVGLVWSIIGLAFWVFVLILLVKCSI